MRILVATASTYGSTREIGDHIAGVLRRAGHDVHTRDIDAVTTLDYDAIVVGTAIYIGRPLTAARKFTARLERELGGKPVWVFASGMKNITRDPLHPPFTEPASRPYLGSRYPIFKGKVDPTQLSAAERTLAALTAASVQDERDFPLIERWAQAIADCLAAAPVDAGR
ncbi:MAG TPA: flavodoxin domain-containing protein [Beutenbergiaceae bacterium]|nr:flavodoxin domain-containing protein [Beutenbergiaceae bacterium]